MKIPSQAILCCLILSISSVQAQSDPSVKLQTPAADSPCAETCGQPSQSAHSGREVIVPSGTSLLLTLRNSISTKNARVGDGVYLESTFPVSGEGGLAIPAGSFLEGRVARIKRPGRIRGRGELEIRLERLILRNGYVIPISAALESADSDDQQMLSGPEGTLKGPRSILTDASIILVTTQEGTSLGLLSLSAKGLAIGTGIGAAAGIATVLITRGEDARLAAGSNLEVVLRRPIRLDASKVPLPAPAPATTIQIQPARNQNRSQDFPWFLPFP